MLALKLLLITALCALATGQGSNPIVRVSHGVLQGAWRTYKGRTYASFEGVPFARPPVGKYRFRAPQQLKPWPGVWDATKQLPICLQYNPLANVTMGSESCLFLNVYTPKPVAGASLPVVAFIHGGAFMYGAGSIYDVSAMMQRDVVVVTLNYRLGPLGFLSTGDEVAPGNAGLKDQAFALQWIQKNIMMFGGNPDSVTLTGCSAGGASVHYHYLSPLSKGTFARGIAFSGSAFASWTHAVKPAEKARALASIVGCPTTSSRELVDCLRYRPAEVLVNGQIEMYDWRVHLFTPFTPTAEPATVKEPFLTQYPYHAAQAGAMHKVPLIATVTSEEGLYPAAVFQSQPDILPELEARWEELASYIFEYNDTLPLSQRAAVAAKIKQYYLGGKPVGQETFAQLVQMKVTGKEKKKLIYAIKFKDLPFPEIDKYVCVPFSWIIHQLDERTVLVAYPENEAPFVTRNRTKKREKSNPEWRFYIGYIKFESENYEDVVQWIEEMLAKGADDQEESEIKDSSAEPVGSRQLRSSKNPLLSGILPKKPKLVVKPYDNPRKPLPKMLIRRPLPLRPWKPKKIEPAVSSPNTPLKDKPVIVEDQVIQNAVNHESTDQSTNDYSQEKSVDTSAQSPPQLPDGRQPSPVQDEQLLSMPEIDNSDVEIEVEIESESIQEKRPPSKNSEQAQPNPVNERPASVTHHEYSLIESRLHEILTGQPQEAIDPKKTSLAQDPNTRPPSRAHQPSQHDYPQPSVTPCLKQQQGTVGTSSKVINSYQNNHHQNHGKTIPSTTYYTPTPIDLSSQRQIPVIRRKWSSVIKKPVELEKKARVENIAKNTPTLQQSYNKQQPYYANHGDVIDHRRHLQIMNTSAAQNLSQLAHLTRYYGPSQFQYLQQMAQMQEMISQSSIPYIDQRTYFPNPMAGGYVSQNQPNQSSQFLSQNQRPIVNKNQMPELRRLVAPPLADHNQLARNLDNSQRQDPRAAKPLESQNNSGSPKPQVTEERPVVLPKTNHQLLNDKKNNSRKDLLRKLSLGPVKHLEICGAAPEITQDSETQTVSESQETQSKQGPENNIYQHPESKKLVADQATEMESIDDRNDETFTNPLESIGSWYDRHEHSTKEQETPQEVPDFDRVSADEELSDNVSTDGLDYANKDYSKYDTSASIIDERSMDSHNLMPGTQQKLSKMAEQEMLEIHGLLLTRMYKNFLSTEEYYNNLRDTTLGCIKLYESLLNKVEKVKVIESLPIPTSNTPEVRQVAQETPVPASEKNSNDDHNNSSAKNSPTKSKRRHTFVLPPEYDPNDSRWTLKHRNPGPGLMELIPQSRVYVRKSEYKKCIRVSNNCRTLARTLLTAVFSKNALSVCSPTGAKARAFNTVEIDVRPGLDENARMVLLAFIEEYGSKRNWNTSDTAGIMSSIRTKIQEMRNKYGKTKVF